MISVSLNGKMLFIVELRNHLELVYTVELDKYLVFESFVSFFLSISIEICSMQNWIFDTQLTRN